MLKMENVEKSYDGVKVLNDFTMNVPDDSCYALVGSNASGKTTVIKLFAGLIEEDSGKIYVDDMEAGLDIKRLKRRIGYVPKYEGRYENINVQEYLEFFASCYGMYGTRTKKKIHEILDIIGLSGKQNSFTDTLSRGMQRRLSIGRALIHDPKFLIMDEPLSGLDHSTIEDIKKIISSLSALGKTILISSHILGDVMDISTDIGLIENGHMIIEGDIEEIREKLNDSNPIIISVDGEITSAIKLLKDEPSVNSISIKDGKIIISFKGGSIKERMLLKKLIDKNIPVCSFYRERVSLESVFRDINKKHRERSILRYDSQSDI